MKKQTSMAGLVIVLCAICLVTSLLLGLVNSVTEGPIEALNKAKTEAAMNEVLPADSYETVDYTGDDGQIVSVSKAGDAGYVVEVSVSGSQGMISMVVGVKADGTVSGVSIVSMKETAGLGDKALEPEYRAQYVGTTGDAAVNKDGGEIVALTGATVTSRAVTNGVNAAVAAAATMG
ncbi:MAG: RnfABCDGE type electron transport complex subunit G [Candidatus Heteroscillospira sp.]|jgi:electron transport complex protein RnfG